MTYGLGRAEILSAQANGLTLLILSAFIVYEAIRRLVAPPSVNASIGTAVAARSTACTFGEVTSGFPALSAHIIVAADTDCHAKCAEIATLLHERFGIEHTTLQVEHRMGLLQIHTPDH